MYCELHVPLLYDKLSVSKASSTCLFSHLRHTLIYSVTDANPHRYMCVYTFSFAPTLVPCKKLPPKGQSVSTTRTSGKDITKERERITYSCMLGKGVAEGVGVAGIT